MGLSPRDIIIIFLACVFFAIFTRCTLALMENEDFIRWMEDY